MYNHPFPLKKRSNFSKSKAIFVLAGIFLGIFIFSYIGYKNDVNKAIDPSDETASSFIVKKGESIKTIGKNLEEKGLIKDSFSFYLYVKMNDFDKKILAGRFLLSKSMPLNKIVEDFTDMKKAEFLVTIQEGLRIVDIDKKLVELELLQEGEFIHAAKNFNGWEYYPFLDKKILSKLEFPVEGYIYPDTYFIDPSAFKPHTLIYLALDNFEKKTANLIPQIKNHTVHEIITMASIIETEVFGGKDRKLVSG
ncbi:MAG: endolytic transglycosylase MltG, partial [Candidatus Gracilibacteria bacterium]|nr:endolytic transglycosylase MltG [Candidatus Gracilibacteria bacterium]